MKTLQRSTSSAHTRAIQNADTLSYRRQTNSAATDNHMCSDENTYSVPGGSVNVRLYSGEQPYVAQLFSGMGFDDLVDGLFCMGGGDMTVCDTVIYFENITYATQCFDSLSNLWKQAEEASFAAMLKTVYSRK